MYIVLRYQEFTFYILQYTLLQYTLNLTYTLISTSTPLGNSNFIKASIVFEDEL